MGKVKPGTPPDIDQGIATERTQIGRLAFRQEGEWWNAYYALTDTMEGAIPLGSIRLTAVTRASPRNAYNKQAFIDLMRNLVADIIEEKSGTRPTWGEPHRAPEHERAGHS